MGSVFLRGRTEKKKAWVKYSHAGKAYREATGSQPDCGPAVYNSDKNWKKKTEAYLDAVLKRVGAAELGLTTYVGAAQNKLRMSELFDSLKAQRKAKEGRGDVVADKAWYSHLERARGWFGDKLALALDADFWDEWSEEEGAELLEEYAPATINRALERVREALNSAVERKKLAGMPGKVRFYSERDNVREGFFEREEFAALIAATENEDYKDFYRYGFLIGWRRAAVAGLKWDSIDRKRGTLTLPWSLDKTKEGNKLPLGSAGEALHDLIEKRWELRKYKNADGVDAVSQYVFHCDGQPIGDIRKAWATACRRATALYKETKGKQGAILSKADEDGTERPIKLYHDFRRTAYLHMLEQGVAEATARTIVGHKTDAMAKRYQITPLRQKEEALSRLSL